MSSVNVSPPAASLTDPPARAAELLAALRRLDALLGRALAAAEVAYGPDAARDRFRGLHLELSDVARILTRRPAEPLVGNGDGAPVEPHSSLPDLARQLGLCPFEADVLMIAAAPDLDLRYERVYAYLQDDVGRRRPRVNLTLDLLCASASEHLSRHRHFASDAPLIRDGLVHLEHDPADVEAPLLGRVVRVDDQVLRMLLGGDELDRRLAPFCRRIAPSQQLERLPLAEEVRRGLVLAGAASSPARLYFQGPPGSGRGRAADAFAAAAGRPLLAADAHGAASAAGPWPETLRLALRQAVLDGAVLYLHDADAILADPDGHLFRALASELATAGTPVIVGGASRWPQITADAPIGMQVVSFGIPEGGVRERLWRTALDAHGAAVPSAAVAAVANRFRLTPGQIAEAAAQGVAATTWRAASTPAREDLFAAARAQCGHELEGLAVKLEPAHDWGDLVLQEDALAQLHELCARVVHRNEVMPVWRRGVRGIGVAALFAGPPGTGKTLAAEVVARELGLDLYRIDLAGVVSKWIGETEKNLGRIFRAAEDGNAILIFDEAEALFGKRSEVRDSHDRYANVEIAYLLQRIEAHDGISILATNQAEDLDEAFRRRIDFIVRFPLPGIEERRRIWEGVWPPGTTLADDVDLLELARDLPFSGAEMHNAALAAAFLAAASRSPIGREHVQHAVRREYEKMGRTLPRRSDEGTT